jgi:hypothetical protein
LAVDVGQTSVAKYMARSKVPPSQGWKTFLRNHADGVAAMDLFVVHRVISPLWAFDYGPQSAVDLVARHHGTSDCRIRRTLVGLKMPRGLEGVSDAY